MVWPSINDESGSVPPLLSLLASGTDDANEARYLLHVAKALKENGYEPLEFQVAVSPNVGLPAIPAVVRSGEKHYLVYSHCGPWNQQRVEKFQKWTEFIRRKAELQSVPILVVYTEAPAELIATTDERHGVFYQHIATPTY